MSVNIERVIISSFPTMDLNANSLDLILEMLKVKVKNKCHIDSAHQV